MIGEDRFWSRVRKTPFGCWEWTGKTYAANPYGRFRTDGRVVYAHRFAYEAEYGPIPVGLHVLHSCDNPPCVNPRHLWLGTNADNQRDKTLKGRQAREGKLTAVDIPLIYAAYAGGFTARQIAARFGVAKRTIYHVLEGHTWQPFIPAKYRRAA